MLKIVYEMPYYLPYVLMFVVSLTVVVGTIFVLKDINIRYLVGIALGSIVFSLSVAVLSMLSSNTKLKYIEQIKNDELPYYTYGKCDLAYDTALVQYGDSEQSSAPIVMYDVKGQGEEWNEIRQIKTREYTFTVYVSHLREELKPVTDTVATDNIASMATPSYVDPRNKAKQ